MVVCCISIKLLINTDTNCVRKLRNKLHVRCLCAGAQKRRRTARVTLAMNAYRAPCVGLIDLRATLGQLSRRCSPCQPRDISAVHLLRREGLNTAALEQRDVSGVYGRADDAQACFTLRVRPRQSTVSDTQMFCNRSALSVHVS